METVSASEAARQTGCTAQRVAKLCREGRVPGAKKHGGGRGVWHIPAEEVEGLRASLRPTRLHRDSSRSAASRVLWTLRVLAESPGGVSKTRLAREIEVRFGQDVGPEAVRSYLNALQDADFGIRDYEEGRREMCALVYSPFGLSSGIQTNVGKGEPWTKYAVRLTDEEWTRLRGIAADPNARPRVRDRALVLLGADAGLSGKEIARDVGVDPVTVWRTRKRYAEEGIGRVLKRGED